MATTIHMDVQAARSVQNRLEKLHASILRIVNGTSSTMSGLPPHWRSDSANQYFGYYYENMGKISSMLEKLSEITSAISSEIDNYERMAERLSD